jgi:hypothetical protein
VKDPLGTSVLQRALARADAAEAAVKRAEFALRQTSIQNEDLVRMLACLLRFHLAQVNRITFPDMEPGPLEEVVLSFAQMAAEGETPKRAYRIDRALQSLTLRLTPFPKEGGETEPPPPPEPEKPPRSRLIVVPGEEGA